MESSDAIGKLLRAEEKYVMVSISRFQIHRLHLIYVCMYGMCVCMCVYYRGVMRDRKKKVLHLRRKSKRCERQFKSLLPAGMHIPTVHIHPHHSYIHTYIHTYIHLLRVV